MSCTKIKRSKQKSPFKKKRKIKNWNTYNEGLKKRGDLTVWFSPDALKKWYYKGKRGHGGHYVYSDLAILLCRTIGIVFHQRLRQQQGMVQSLFKLLKAKQSVPNYSVVSRRSGKIQKELVRLKSELNKARGQKSGRVEMIVDSTGIKIYGEGEWMTTKHKTKIRKSWMKLHASSERDSWINASTLTGHRESDTSQVAPLRSQIDADVGDFIADGAYDSKGVFGTLLSQNNYPPSLIVPPIKGAVLSQATEFQQRNNHIIFIDKHGRDAWEKASGYTFQSKSENTFFRYKTIIGRTFSSRTVPNQETEATLGCLILNKMYLQGMPEYENKR